MATANSIDEAPADLVLRSAMVALERALCPAGGAITPATETQVQNAIDFLRKTGTDSHLLPRLEEIARELRIISNARLRGRPNLCDSRLARLRRSLFR